MQPCQISAAPHSTMYYELIVVFIGRYDDMKYRFIVSYEMNTAYASAMVIQYYI